MLQGIEVSEETDPIGAGSVLPESRLTLPRGWVPLDIGGHGRPMNGDVQCSSVSLPPSPGRGSTSCARRQAWRNARLQRHLDARASLRRIDVSLSVDDAGGFGRGHDAHRTRHQHAAAAALSSAAGRRGRSHGRCHVRRPAAPRRQRRLFARRPGGIRSPSQPAGAAHARGPGADPRGLERRAGKPRQRALPAARLHAASGARPSASDLQSVGPSMPRSGEPLALATN